MKTFLLSLVATAALVTTAPAQLVHLTIHGTVTDRFGGEGWWPAPDAGIGETATLHLFYDPGLPVSMAAPWLPETTYTANSARNNHWRLSYGAIEVTAPFDTLTVSDTELRAHAFSFSSLTTLDLRLVFASDPSPGFDLPVPPYPALASVDPLNPFDVNPSRWVFDTTGLGGIDSGSVYVDVLNVQTERVPRFQPVPEPGAYALFAGALLGAAVWHRTLLRRRRLASL